MNIKNDDNNLGEEGVIQSVPSSLDLWQQSKAADE